MKSPDKVDKLLVWVTKKVVMLTSPSLKMEKDVKIRESSERNPTKKGTVREGSGYSLAWSFILTRILVLALALNLSLENFLGWQS